MGGDVPRRTPDYLVFGDLSKDVFCVLIVYSCRSVGVCREVFRVRVRLYVCEQILQPYFQFERVQKLKCLSCAFAHGEDDDA